LGAGGGSKKPPSGPTTGADTPDPSGGKGPVDKGKEGVNKLAKWLALCGEREVAREVTLELPDGSRIRPDLVTQTKSGQLKYYDAKNGPNAGMSQHQQDNYDKINESGATVRTDKLCGVGITSGTKIGPTDITVVDVTNFPD
jgi:hypothetical protein